MPVDAGHTETFLFTTGSSFRGGIGGTSVDFNYGIGHGSHVNLVLPVDYDRPTHGRLSQGVSNVELAVKMRVMEQARSGWDVAVYPRLHVGGELVQETPFAKGERATTGLGAGVTYDLNDHYHLLAYAGPNLQNVPQTVRYSWYAALQVTY